jgi:hypothetical protein
MDRSGEELWAAPVSWRGGAGLCYRNHFMGSGVTKNDPEGPSAH